MRQREVINALMFTGSLSFRCTFLHKERKARSWCLLLVLANKSFLAILYLIRPFFITNEVITSEPVSGGVVEIWYESEN